MEKILPINNIEQTISGFYSGPVGPILKSMLAGVDPKIMGGVEFVYFVPWMF